MSLFDSLNCDEFKSLIISKISYSRIFKKCEFKCSITKQNGKYTSFWLFEKKQIQSDIHTILTTDWLSKLKKGLKDGTTTLLIHIII